MFVTRPRFCYPKTEEVCPKEGVTHIKGITPILFLPHHCLFCVSSSVWQTNLSVKLNLEQCPVRIPVRMQTFFWSIVLPFYTTVFKVVNQVCRITYGLLNSMWLLHNQEKYFYRVTYSPLIISLSDISSVLVRPAFCLSLFL